MEEVSKPFLRKKSTSPKVFILNAKDGWDYSRAKEYGELVVLSEGPINIYNPHHLVDCLKRGLPQYKEGDYLVLSGNNLPVYFAALFLKTIKPHLKKHKVLVYDMKQYCYVSHTLDVGCLDSIMGN